jgi:hypothetical protein
MIMMASVAFVLLIASRTSPTCPGARQARSREWPFASRSVPMLAHHPPAAESVLTALIAALGVGFAYAFLQWIKANILLLPFGCSSRSTARAVVHDIAETRDAGRAGHSVGSTKLE